MKSFLLFALVLLLCFSFYFFSFYEKKKSSSTDFRKDEKITPSFLLSEKNKILSLYDSMKTPLPGEWLAEHEERFITLEQYLKSKPVRPDEIRNVIYLQPFNDLDSNGKKIVHTAAEYLMAFYGLKVIINEPVDISLVPSDYRRSRGGSEQIKTGYLLNKFLKPALPADGIVMIGLTGKDLYPEDDWNFVFGQAYLKNRVGVWSINRLCDLENMNDSTKFSRCITRALNTAAHETGHMFSIEHCLKFNCVMNGSNSLEESDSRPSWLCPDCLCKLSWNLQRAPLEHFTSLKSFWEKNQNKKVTSFYSKNIEALSKK